MKEVKKMSKTDWIMLLSMVKVIVEQAETKEKALEELEKLIEKAEHKDMKA